MGVAGQATDMSSIARDTNGNIFTFGITYGDLHDQTVASAGTSDAALIKFDSSGSSCLTCAHMRDIFFCRLAALDATLGTLGWQDERQGGSN